MVDQMNKQGLTVSDLIAYMRSIETDANRVFALKDGAFTYDVDGLLETQLLDADMCDFDWDGNRITVTGVSGSRSSYTWTLLESDEHWAN